jgi:hypothetical protein
MPTPAPTPATPTVEYLLQQHLTLAEQQVTILKELLTIVKSMQEATWNASGRPTTPPNGK